MSGEWRIPVLLDDFICFVVALAGAVVASLLGAWLGRLVRQRRQRCTPEWRPTCRGVVVAALLLFGGGVGYLSWASDRVANRGLLGKVFWEDSWSGWGGLERLIIIECVLAYWAVVSIIALTTSLVSAMRHRPEPTEGTDLRFSLWRLLGVLLVTSVALGLWIGARR